MHCALCGRQAPEDFDKVVADGWIPSYYVGQQEMEGPVCPKCLFKRLWLSADGEWELRVPKSEAHRYN